MLAHFRPFRIIHYDAEIVEKKIASKMFQLVRIEEYFMVLFIFVDERIICKRQESFRGEEG